MIFNVYIGVGFYLNSLNKKEKKKRIDSYD